METAYRIREDESGLSIEVEGVGTKQAELMLAFGECQEGQCSCPTDEYKKLASMDAKQSGDSIKLRLEAKAGEKFDASEIAACLDYTTQKLDETSNPASK
jgi:hypothetical protein